MSKSAAMNCQDVVLRYKNGDADAINELPLYIDNMIYSLLKPYKLYPDRDDMYQVAWATIMKCIERYDPNRGTMFTTFAYPAIKREFRQYRRRIDKHKNEYNEESECIFEILPLDGYTVCKDEGKAKLLPLSNYLKSENEVEDTALVHEVKRVIKQTLASYTNDKQVAIIADYLCGIKGVCIAYEYNVSSAYVSRVVKEFFNKVREELNK